MVKKTKKLYQGLGWPSIFAHIRFFTAPYKKLEALIPKKGFVIDLGCGYGIFSNYLGLTGPKREILGFELDREKIKYAHHGIRNVKFQQADIVKTNLKKADVILLVHVLHHLGSFREQKELLRQCKLKLRKGGSLIIAEVDKKPILKHFLSWLTDRILYFGNKIYYRFEENLVMLIKRTGFSACQTIKAHQGTPFSTLIYIANNKKALKHR